MYNNYIVFVTHQNNVYDVPVLLIVYVTQ